MPDRGLRGGTGGDWDPLPGEGFIMKAGSATQITEFDKWMLRDWWRHLKANRGW